VPLKFPEVFQFSDRGPHIVEVIRNGDDLRNNGRIACLLPHKVHEGNEEVGLLGGLLCKIVTFKRINHFHLDETYLGVGPHPPTVSVPQRHELYGAPIERGEIEVGKLL
jgi:hypothetical protein